MAHMSIDIGEGTLVSTLFAWRFIHCVCTDYGEVDHVLHLLHSTHQEFGQFMSDVIGFAPRIGSIFVDVAFLTDLMALFVYRKRRRRMF